MLRIAFTRSPFLIRLRVGETYWNSQDFVPHLETRSHSPPAVVIAAALGQARKLMRKTMEHAILVYLSLTLVAYPFLFTLIYKIWRQRRR